MRKKLLSLVALAFVAIGISAQTWDIPEVPEPATVGSDPVSGHIYHVRHVQASAAFTQQLREEEGDETLNVDAFIGGGQVWFTWSTTAMLTGAYEEDSAIGFTLTEEENGWTFKGYDGLWPNNYLFVSGNNGQGALSADSESVGYAMHVDNPTDVHRYFELVKQESGYYRIRVAANDEGYGETAVTNWENKYLGWNPTEESYPNNLHASVTAANGYELDFEFIDTYLQVYEIKTKLYSLAEAIVLEDLNVDYEQFTSVYNGNDYDALVNAYEQLTSLTQTARVNSILGVGADGINPPSDSNPADATPLIENYDFTGCSNGNFPGWTIYAPNGGNTWVHGATAVEYWNATAASGQFDYYQVLTGLPAGKYTLTASMWNSMNGVSGTFEATSGVYGTTSFGTQAALVEDDCDDGNLHEYTTLAIILNEGDDLRIGVKNVKTMVARWFGVDYIHLTYYGPVTEDPEKINLDGLIVKYENQYGEDAATIMANKDVKAAYAAALAAAKSATSDYATYTENLNAAVENLKVSIAEYTRLYNLISNWGEKAADVDGTKWAQAAEDVADKLEEMSEGYDNGTYTLEDIDAAEDFISNTFANIIGELVEKGDDLTFLLNNPGFDTDFSGWTKPEEFVSPAWGGLATGGNPLTYYITEDEEQIEKTLESGNAEVYRAKFDISQTIKNMPAGLFTLSCQAFERDDSGTGIDAELYAILPDGTEKVVKLKSLWSEQSPVQLYSSAVTGVADTNYDSAYGTGFVPNGMVGANIYFAEGFYKNFFDFNVPERGDVVVGIRNLKGGEAWGSSGDWVLFDDFKIVYKGDDASAYKETIERLLDEVAAIQKDYEDEVHNYTQTAITGLDNATQKGNQVLDEIETATKEDAIGAIDELTAAIEYANKSVELIEKLIDTGAYFQELLSITTVVGNNNELQTLLDDINMKDEVYDSNEDIEGWLAEMPAKWFAYVLSQDGFDTAKEDNALDVTDFIINPNFDATGSEVVQNPPYWTVDKMGVNNGYQNNETYTSTDGEYVLDQFVESWGNGTVLTDGAIQQTLSGILPAGYYALEVDGKVDGEEGISLVAINGETTKKAAINNAADIDHYRVEFYSNGTDETTVGIFIESTTAKWVVFDNFKLFYLGTTPPTAVESINAATEKKATVIYNLAGQRVQKAVRGLYIINGKKVLVK